MQPIITSEVVVAYAQCHGKPICSCSAPSKHPHEYIRVLERHRRAHQAQYLDSSRARTWMCIPTRWSTCAMQALC